MAQLTQTFISAGSTNNQFTDLTHIQLFIQQLDLLLELLHLQLPVGYFLSEVAFIQRSHILISLQIKLPQLVKQYRRGAARYNHSKQISERGIYRSTGSSRRSRMSRLFLTGERFRPLHMEQVKVTLTKKTKQKQTEPLPC